MSILQAVITMLWGLFKSLAMLTGMVIIVIALIAWGYIKADERKKNKDRY